MLLACMHVCMEKCFLVVGWLVGLRCIQGKKYYVEFYIYLSTYYQFSIILLFSYFGKTYSFLFCN